MTASLIAQLIVALGPSALKLIPDLVAVWEKPALTVEEVLAICGKAQKNYDDYIAEAKASIKPPVPPA